MYSVRRSIIDAVNFVRPLWTTLNDLVLNIRTMPPSASDASPGPGRPKWRGPFSRNAKHDDNFGYASPNYWYIRAIVRRLKLGRNDVFYDIGCGMGRILCVVARHPIRKCVGIELLESLCVIARRNAHRLRGRETPIEIVGADAARADLSEGTVYCLFNPFGAETLHDFLANLELSVLHDPRRVRLVYYNSLHESVLKESGWLNMQDEFKTLSGLHVTFWESCAGIRAQEREARGEAEMACARVQR